MATLTEGILFEEDRPENVTVSRFWNSNKSPTGCNNFSSLLSWCLFTAQHVSGVLTSIIRSSTTAVAASGFTVVAWWQQCCWSWSGRSDHDQNHCYHHAPKVKPEAATAVVELLMMDVRTPETCWAVNKHQDNKLEKLLHLVGDLFELYDDARTYKF